MRVLVTFASKHGATAEIAFHIATVFKEYGFDVVVGAIGEVNYVASYDAVIIGSALYGRQWMPAAAQFLTTRADILSQKEVWLFSSGPTGTGIATEMFGGFHFSEELLPHVQAINPRGIAIFHGKLDITNLSLAELQIVKNYGGELGDFRNWGEITAWAEGIIGTLQQSTDAQV